jgi:hypothetical protein
VTLRHEEEYPFNEGRIISSHGLDISANDYDVYFSEQHVKHSTALQSRLCVYAVQRLFGWAVSAR